MKRAASPARRALSTPAWGLCLLSSCLLGLACSSADREPAPDAQAAAPADPDPSDPAAEGTKAEGAETRAGPSTETSEGESGGAETGAPLAPPIPSIDPDAEIRCPSRELETPGPVWSLAALDSSLLLRLDDGVLMHFDPDTAVATKIEAPPIHGFIRGGDQPYPCTSSTQLLRLNEKQTRVEPIPDYPGTCTATAVGDQVIYVGEAGEVMRPSYTGPYWLTPGQKTRGLGIPGYIDALAMNATTLFVADGDTISAHSLNIGSKAEARELATVHGYVLAFRATDTHLYWSNNGRLLRTPVAGGSVEVLVNQQEIETFAFLDGYAYWSNDEGLARIALADPGPGGRELEQLVGVRKYGHEMALQGPRPGSLPRAWLAPRKGKILEVTLAGCEPEAWSRRAAIVPTKPPAHIQRVYVGSTSDTSASFGTSDLSTSELWELSEFMDGDASPTGTTVPARFRPGSLFTVIGTRGRLEGKASDSFEVYEGASDSFAGLELDLRCIAPRSTKRADPRRAGPRRADPRRADPKRADPGSPSLDRCLDPDDNFALIFHGPNAHPGLTLRIPASVNEGPVFTKIGASIHALARAEGSLSSLGSKFDPDKWTLELMPAELTRGGAYLVTVEYLEDNDDMEALTGFAVFDAEGVLVEWIQALGMRLDTFHVDAVFDLDGDGFEEIVYTSTYYEGAFTFLLEHSATGYHAEVLDGDGA